MTETTNTFTPTACPALPAPSAEEVRTILASPKGAADLAAYYHDREKRILAAKLDPYRYGFEFPHWRRADEQVNLVELGVYVGGGKRASKSEWAAKRVVQAAMAYPEGVIWCFQGNEKTSINTQQEVVWRYLPPEVRKLNNKSSQVHKLKYAEGRGFTDMFLVLPNGTKIFFLTYNQKTDGFEGWELGARVTKPVLDERGVVIANIGAWPDENMPLPWFQTIKLRLATRGAKMIWTYSPMHGITTTIKEFRGPAKTIESRPAELLAGRRNVPDCPDGEMPFIEQPITRGARIIYFFTQWNPFGNYPAVKNLLADKPVDQIKQDAYGYANDTMHRAFPLFGSWNIISQAALPETGSNYQLTDPAGARNWATLWVRVGPGKEPNVYIYREWPDEPRYGEWAVPSENPQKADGDPGPAQKGLGYGVAQYKKMFLAEEVIRPVWKDGKLANADPQARKQLQTANCKLPIEPEAAASPQSAVCNLKFAIQEVIHERLIDPRAGRSQMVAEKGGTCLIDEFATEQRDPKSGAVTGPKMLFWPASGVDIVDGIVAVNGLLAWEKEEPLVPLLNAPHLYVTDTCRNVIWCLSNWTGLDGEHGASKDFVDLVRYLALGQLRHVPPGTVRRGGGSY